MDSKKGAFDLQMMAPAAIAFVFIAIVMTIGADVVANVQADQLTNTAGCNSTDVSACSAAYNASAFGLQSQQELASWLPTIALVVAAAVVIGVLSYFKS